MMVRPASTLFSILCLLEVTYAMMWSGPQVTPAGLMAMKGMSPRPTQAPGGNGIPRELRKRAEDQYLYPPPLNWCGFVEGDYSMIQDDLRRTELTKLVDNVLSCATDYSCSYLETAVGCCTGPVEQCQDVYTTCVDRVSTSICDADCTENNRIIKWYFGEFEAESFLLG